MATFEIKEKAFKFLLEAKIISVDEYQKCIAVVSESTMEYSQ